MASIYRRGLELEKVPGDFVFRRQNSRRRTSHRFWFAGSAVARPTPTAERNVTQALTQGQT